MAVFRSAQVWCSVVILLITNYFSYKATIGSKSSIIISLGFLVELLHVLQISLYYSVLVHEIDVDVVNMSLQETDLSSAVPSAPELVLFNDLEFSLVLRGIVEVLNITRDLKFVKNAFCTFEVQFKPFHGNQPAA